jgi:hypothetical protein
MMFNELLAVDGKLLAGALRACARACAPAIAKPKCASLRGILLRLDEAGLELYSSNEKASLRWRLGGIRHYVVSFVAERGSALRVAKLVERQPRVRLFSDGSVHWGEDCGRFDRLPAGYPATVVYSFEAAAKRDVVSASYTSLPAAQLEGVCAAFRLASTAPKRDIRLRVSSRRGLEHVLEIRSPDAPALTALLQT